MTILDETVIDLKAKYKTNGVKVRRLDEMARISGSKQFRGALRTAAEAILGDAEKHLFDMWRDNPDMKGEYKNRKEFIEEELREIVEDITDDFIKTLDDEVDVVLTHKHGI